jgi:acrylyl-CoA reductase (NADPH)
MADTFKALMMRETEDGKVAAAIEEISVADLPEGEVLVKVEHSTLNYKDGLVVDGNKGRLARKFPHIPGIDLAGTVLESSDARYAVGDRVVVTGWHMGERYWGGFSEVARVRADWLVHVPATMTTRQAMAVGTAGLTSMFALMALEEHGLKPGGDKPVLVTGGAGGVGSVAIALLARHGYTVAASTGRPELGDYLTGLGATEIVTREELAEDSAAPLESERWAGCIDAVAGSTISRVIRQLERGASVAACGLAGGATFDGHIMPFLLRGVNLLGIDSVAMPYERRVIAWNRMADELDLSLLDEMTGGCSLEEIPAQAKAILKGQVKGRLVVDIA